MESSALVAALLEHDPAVLKAPAGTQHVTSALTLAEAGRAIIRARTTGRLTPADEQAAVRALRTFERRCFIVDVDRRCLLACAARFQSNRSARSMRCILRRQNCSARRHKW
jgi:hypothetical protein